LNAEGKITMSSATMFLGWESEVPQYRVRRAVHPSPKSRHRTEPPFSSSSDDSCWQYAERSYKAGEIISTTSWPHPTFAAINFAAEQVLRFFQSAPKSRLPISPWFGDRVRLDSGLSGNGPRPQIVTPAQVRGQFVGR
jgi:hypothetical protein